MGGGERPPNRRESLLSWFILGLLVLIAIRVFSEQFDYDPAVINPGVPESQGFPEVRPESSSGSGLADMVPSDMGVMSPPEYFGPENLSDKINGKAELYLSAGVLSLQSQRFARRADPQSWMEVFVYDMGSLRQAFAVYSTQKRDESEPLDLTPFCTRTQNALYLVHGRYYVEIVASVASEDLMAAVLTTGREFVRRTPVKGEQIDELALFPQEDLEAGSLLLLASDAFGFQDMKNVFTGRYRVNGQKLTAFLTRTDRSEEALALVAAYASFLEANGGAPVSLDSPIEGGMLVRIMDTFELFFPHGPYVAGVHGAETEEAAEALALMLKTALARSVQ